MTDQEVVTSEQRQSLLEVLYSPRARAWHPILAGSGPSLGPNFRLKFRYGRLGFDPDLALGAPGTIKLPTIGTRAKQAFYIRTVCGSICRWFSELPILPDPLSDLSGLAATTQ